jgi:citrate lyase beta subunit
LPKGHSCAARGGAEVFMRINKPVEMMIEDLDTALRPGLTGIAVARGTASVSMDGRMIDLPIAEKARRILARANAIAARETRKAEALRLAGVA